MYIHKNEPFIFLKIGMAQNRICQNSCVCGAKPVAVLQTASTSLGEVKFYASMIGLSFNISNASCSDKFWLF